MCWRSCLDIQVLTVLKPMLQCNVLVRTIFNEDAETQAGSCFMVGGYRDSGVFAYAQ
jgi:hypothetical protein